MKKLDLGFRSSTKHTTHHLQVKYVKEELDAKEIRKAMESIAELGIFADKKGDLIYATPVSASYVDTNEEVVFDDTVSEVQ